MAIYMPPLCRKKKVIGRYNPDTFRVISEYAEESHLKTDFEEVNKPSEWRKTWLENEGLALPDIYNRKTEVLPQAVPDFRAHRPHPGSCGFLRHNVRFLNEPICSVYTKIQESEPQHWWPSRVSSEPLQVPPRTNNTIYRSDFLQARPLSSGHVASRHTANPNKEPALGAVPVNFLKPRDGQQRFFKEKISYEHQYNSRNDPNYPIRGKRHGAFVWDGMSKAATKKFIDHYSVISPEEGIQRQEAYEAEKLAKEVAKCLEATTMEPSAPKPAEVMVETAPEPVNESQSNQQPKPKSPPVSTGDTKVNGDTVAPVEHDCKNATDSKKSSRKNSTSNGNTEVEKVKSPEELNSIVNNEINSQVKEE